ncbi:MAG: mechanosensitive ion channel family protein, partial [Cyclobacteriaceae bacterium]|nr:mechanosensitive ion channel family protein [Cyclobacteriaceae bacterium]
MKLRRIILSLNFLFLLSIQLQAQLIRDNAASISDSNRPNLSTPYHTTLTFFHNLEDNNFFPENAASTLDLTGANDADGTKLSIKLKQVFEGQGIIIRASQIPRLADYQDTTGLTTEDIYYFDKDKLPGVFLEKRGSEWKFSAFTVSQIETLHKRTYPYGTDRLLNLLPK